MCMVQRETESSSVLYMFSGSIGLHFRIYQSAFLLRLVDGTETSSDAGG
jgi:hypothetical protein